MYIPFGCTQKAQTSSVARGSSNMRCFWVFLKGAVSDVAISNLLLIDKMSSPADIAKKHVITCSVGKPFHQSQAVKWSLKWIEMDGHPHSLVSSQNLPKTPKTAHFIIYFFWGPTIFELFTVCFPILHGRLGHAFRVSHFFHPFRRGVRLHLFLPMEGGKEQVWALTSHLSQKNIHTSRIWRHQWRNMKLPCFPEWWCKGNDTYW